MRLTKEMSNVLFSEITKLLASKSFKESHVNYYVIVMRGSLLKLARNPAEVPILGIDDTKLLILRVWDAKESRSLTKFKDQFYNELSRILTLRGFKEYTIFEKECEGLQKELLALEKHLDYLAINRPISIGLITNAIDKKEAVSIGMDTLCYYDGVSDTYYPLHYKGVFLGDVKTNIVNLADTRSGMNKYAYMINDLLTFDLKSVKGLAASLKVKSMRYNQTNLDLAKELKKTCKYLIKQTESISGEMSLVRKAEREYARYKQGKI